MNAIICLVEDSYWAGVTAIINSAIRNNFMGYIYIGYRGKIPKWIDKFEQIDDKQNYLINHNIQLKLVEIDSQRHLGFEKPFFIEKIINRAPLDFIFYFDIDCVSVCDFDFYLTWCKQHIGLCMDECYSSIHMNHPWKIYWKNKLNEYRLPLLELNHPYINSGFIGLSKINFDIITIWKSITIALENEGFDTKKLNKSPLLPIQGDQEILNMALMTKETHQVSIIGKEGMGFTEPCYLMVHCTKPEKPWEKLFLVDFIKKGYPIAAREKKYLDFLTKPYNNLGKTKTLFKKIDIFITQIASRIF